MTPSRTASTCPSAPAMRGPSFGLDAGDLAYWGSNWLLIRRNPTSGEYAFHRAHDRTQCPEAIAQVLSGQLIEW
jgi:hypothetical protein